MPLLPRAPLRCLVPLRGLLTALILTWSSGVSRGAETPALTSRAPASTSATNGVFRAPKLAEIDTAILAAISNRALPGAVLWIEHAGGVYSRAYGRKAVQPKPEPMSADTIFDAASLTKVLATTPAVMLLAERGRLDIEAPVKTYLPEFTGDGREALTVRHLLTHTSGLRPGLGGRFDGGGYAAAITAATTEKPEYPAGTRFRYSDINFILLGEVVHRVSGQPLDAFCAREIFEPLGMKETGFKPAAALRERIAPTTYEQKAYLRGVVHDPTARRMDGVAGHAGVFTTAADLARFARMMLNEGTLDGRRLFQPETVRRMTQVQTPTALADARRGLGWDIDTAYAGPRGDVFPVGSYGHTGWTGTSLWIDPFSRTFVILLSNRNHPNEDGNVLALRRRVGTLAAEALSDFDFGKVPGALPRQPPANGKPAVGSPNGAGTRTNRVDATPSPAPPPAMVRNGIDVLVAQNFAPLRKRRIGLITNHTGVDAQRRATIDLLREAPEVELKALFSPEHGIRGAVDEKVADSVDAKTGLPVYSLYGETRRPKTEQLAGLDTLVFDIQDIGCRFYTYVATMGECLHAASQAGLSFVVLDRINPINGVTVEGPVYQGATNLFVAFHALPVRHGMTAGELAKMFNAERGWNASLTVIPVEGWHREAWFDQVGLPWVNPSPNMRNLKEAALYPGVGLVEFAVSVGRGTDTPFEVVGAPYVQDQTLAAELNRAALPGVRFVPIRFTPRASVFKDQECGGVYINLLDREACPTVSLGVLLAATLQRLYPGQFALEKVATLLLHPATQEGLKAGKSLADLQSTWSTDLKEFQVRRGRFLLY